MTKNANALTGTAYSWANGSTHFAPEANVPTILGKVLFNNAHLVALKVGYDLGSGIIYTSVAASIARANTAATYTAQSVVDGGPASTLCNGAWTSHHSCGSGETNDQTRTDYNASMNMMQAAIDSAMAYCMTMNTTYADKAVALLKHWALDAATYMEPDSFFTGMSEGDKLRFALVIPGFFLAADLLENYSGWQASKAAFKTWANDFGAALAAVRPTSVDNKTTWCLSAEAAAGAISGDAAMISAATASFTSHLGQGYLIASNGTTLIDRDRTGVGLGYQTFHLAAMVLLAEISFLNGGTDLYAYTTSGKGIKLVADTMLPFAGDASMPAAWNAFATTNGYAQQTNVDDVAGNSGSYEILDRRIVTDYSSVFSTLITRPASYMPNFYSLRWPLDWTLMGYE